MQSKVGKFMLPQVGTASEGDTELNQPSVHSADDNAIIKAIRSMAATDLPAVEATLAGIVALNANSVGMQTTTASNLNSPGVAPVSAISLCFKTNGNSTNSMSLNISGTSVGWKAIATA